MYVCMYVRIYVCKYVCMYVYVCIYVYMQVKKNVEKPALCQCFDGGLDGQVDLEQPDLNPKEFHNLSSKVHHIHTYFHPYIY